MFLLSICLSVFFISWFLVTTPQRPPTQAPCHISLPLTLSSNSTFENLSCVPVNEIIPCLQRRKQRSQTHWVPKATQLGVFAGDGPGPWTSGALLCALTMVPVAASLPEGYTRMQESTLLEPTGAESAWCWSLPSPPIQGQCDGLKTIPPWPPHWHLRFEIHTPLPNICLGWSSLEIILTNPFHRNPHLKLSTGKTDAGFKAKSVWLHSFATVLGFERCWSYALLLPRLPQPFKKTRGLAGALETSTYSDMLCLLISYPYHNYIVSEAKELWTS